VSLPPRSVCLDVQGAQNSTHFDRGIPRFVVEHARALESLHPEALHSLVANPTLPLSGNLDWLLGSGRLHWTTADRRTFRRPVGVPRIYHIMSPFEIDRTLDELWPSWARGGGVSTVVTLYDLIPIVFHEHYLRDPVIRARYETRATIVRRADHVFAISRSTADDAIERLGVAPDRVTVIDAGATAKFSTMYDSREAARRVLDRCLPEVHPGFMLYVAGFEFRKNLERLIAGYGKLAPEIRAAHQMVIACRVLPSEAELMHHWAQEAGIGEGELVVTGYVSDAELGALYHACTLFVFASFYEGSGLPILEAMSCGAPVAASNTSTGPEILGDLQATFDPFDPDSIADCLASVIDAPELLDVLAQRSRQRVARYTWRSVAERTLLGYERALTHGVRGASQRPRIALVTPWPPEQSGVADYSYRLATALGERADVDVVVAQTLDRYAVPQERGVRLVQASSFRATEALRQHDRVMYCMGNSHFHGHVYELLRQRPGAVLAHDVRLTGFYGWFAGRERPEDPAARLVERIRVLYGQRLPRELTAEGARPPSWEQQSALGIYMTREIQEHAEQLFVHSRHALDVLELDRGPLDREVPLTVFPHAFPEVVQHKRGPFGQTPLVVSVGVVSEVKGLACLINAFGLLAVEWPHARLVIAGPAPESELARWRRFAREHAPHAHVDLPGHLSAVHYRELLRTADLAVQLRMLSNGEASGAVVDCLAAGLPTVVTDLGWASELPGDAVFHVPVEVDAAILAARLRELLGDGVRRERLSHGATAHARSHSFADVADAYLRALQLV
jgi:glycosyltransferase involved in cell wall biosynthesis